MDIGFFDSGVGGFAIMNAVRETLPAYHYVYFGDTANVPYGGKSEAEIVALTEAGVEYLFEHNCALVVLACNTASAETLRTLQDGYLKERYPDRKILGVIIPTVEEVIMQGARSTLLIATQRTVASRKYERELAARNIMHMRFQSVATPTLVPLIERGDIVSAADDALAVIEEYRAGEEPVDTVILGCTHYTVLKDRIRAQVGESISVIAQDEVIPRKLADYLLRHPEIESTLRREPGSTEFFTGAVDRLLLTTLTTYREERGS